MNLARAAAAFLSAFAVTTASAAPGSQLREERMAPAAGPVTLVIHGGAGALAKGKYSAEDEAAYRAKLEEALAAGYAILEANGTALDAVEAAIVILEDSPLFNAGRGAVFTAEGTNELDASVMEGRELKAGAVAGVKTVKNPIRLARAVMEQSEHVMMAGAGAEAFARERKLEAVPASYFRTDSRWKDYQDALRRQQQKRAALASDKHGTVGAVALDIHGDLAAGTSTGGMLMKRYGRVGDSPILGAGTYADNRSCAVSATGWGEYFIRLSVARTICAEVEFGGKSLAAAADDVINTRLAAAGGDGGVIVLDRTGAYAMTFNSQGMFRAVRQGDRVEVAIYRD